MHALGEVEITPRSIEPFGELLGEHRFHWLRRDLAEIRGLLGDRIFWHVNSTAKGGGVAEMLLPVCGYDRGADVDTRWLVISGDPRFFALTKSIHNGLHGVDGRPGEPDRRHYEEVLARNGRQLLDQVRPGDVVLCHDPQTAGLIPRLRRAGVLVAWRSHIGHERVVGSVERMWRFLERYLREAHLLIFTREEFVPPFLRDLHHRLDPPCIDPLSAKNVLLPRANVRAILLRAGILSGQRGKGTAVFPRADGSVGRVQRTAGILRAGRPPPFGTPLVVQVSRWDRLKDPLGVLRAFTQHFRKDDVHLTLAGPDISGVADDPEGAEVLGEVEAAWHALEPALRERVHIVSLPMEDRAENAAIVNALQRYASVVVQKSIYEGFGLTVTEGMWKGRPVVASAVGGIPEQIVHGVHGLLVRDPHDLEAFARAVMRLIEDPKLARRLGRNARRRARSHFLVSQQIRQHLEICRWLIGDGAVRGAANVRSANPVGGLAGSRPGSA
ncbi:MAG: glycosyltransferase [Planctomycetota bacterium]